MWLDLAGQGLTCDLDVNLMAAFYALMRTDLSGNALTIECAICTPVISKNASMCHFRTLNGMAKPSTSRNVLLNRVSSSWLCLTYLHCRLPACSSGICATS